MLVALLIASRPIRVLFVGDSFTYFNNLPLLVQDIAYATPGRDVLAERVTSSSWTLSRHWTEGPAPDRIREARWDYVVLQEENTVPITDYKRFAASTRHFANAIRNAGAKPLLVMTWAQRQKPWSLEPISSAIHRVSRDLGVPVIPVGEAWHLWLRDPNAPRLHISDDVHPTFRGSFLSALVIVGRLRSEPLTNSPTDFRHLIDIDHDVDKKAFEAKVDPAELPRLIECAREALESEP